MPNPEINRRTFFNWLTPGFVLLGLSMSSSVYATVRFLFPKVLYEPSAEFKIGKPTEYSSAAPNFIEDKKVFLFMQDDGIFCVSAICTHLGCTVNWLDSESKFVCPCHGSNFDSGGGVIKGPAPGDLERYEVTLAKDGRLVINTRKIVGPDYRLLV